MTIGSKNNIREKILKERRVFNEDSKFSANQKIIEDVRNLLNVLDQDRENNIKKKDLVVGLYWPLKGEPDLLKLAINNKITIAIPKIYGERMDFVRHAPGSPLEISSFLKMMQPKSNNKLKPDIVIIPSLAYSLHGYRLGFGLGYYDKYFTKIDVNFKIIKIGICFHEYLYESLPKEDHDIKMDYVITDKTIIAL